MKNFINIVNTTNRTLKMKEFQLGEFEEIVLLTVGVLYQNAYGVAIKDEIESRINRKVSVGAMQSALRRMEKKGYLTSKEGESNEQRGGKPKKYFSITAYGKKALEYSKDIRMQLWTAIPPAAFDLKLV